MKKAFGARVIIDLERLRIYRGDRVGIVGVNGAGKTSLVKILSQRLLPDQGWVRLYAKGASVSQLDPPAQGTIGPEMASRFSVPREWDERMSGGEKTRFKLALGFQDDSQILFLDEPTSNLDLEGIELLEKRLREYEGAVVLVTHDRELLDGLCNRILEIEHGQIKLYKGNYQAYRQRKKEEKERAQSEYDRYLEKKRRLEGVGVELKAKAGSIKRPPRRMGNSEARLHKMGGQKAKATLDRSAKNIKARLKHLEIKEKPYRSGVIKVDLAEEQRLYSKVIIEGRAVNKAFDAKVIFDDAEFTITNGAKVALVGPNGSGKTTLLKMIMGQEAGIKTAPEAAVGYYSQDLSNLAEDSTILENVMTAGARDQTRARTLLARLLFTGDDVFKPVSALSGGERVKVQVAKMLIMEVNLLILDEPTNYLDLDSLAVLEEELKNYQQTILLVSHDRRLINTVADQIMTIEGGKIKLFQGSYRQFLVARQERPDLRADEIKERMILLQNRLAEVMGKLAMPSKKDDPVALDNQYHQLLAELAKNRAKLRGIGEVGRN